MSQSKALETTTEGRKRISSKCFSHLNVSNNVFFISVFVFPYYRHIWVTCNDLQRQDQVNHVFCPGGLVYIKLSENGSSVKLYM